MVIVFVLKSAAKWSVCIINFKKIPPIVVNVAAVFLLRDVITTCVELLKK